jgi:hypothetical protein
MDNDLAGVKEEEDEDEDEGGKGKRVKKEHRAADASEGN